MTRLREGELGEAGLCGQVGQRAEELISRQACGPEGWGLCSRFPCGPLLIERVSFVSKSNATARDGASEGLSDKQRKHSRLGAIAGL